MNFNKVHIQITKDNTISYNAKITQPKDIVNFIDSIENYSYYATEVVIVIALNTKNEIIAYCEINKGGINTCNIDIPSIFRVLFGTNANKFILAHNHPSGDSTPSKQDIEVTKKIQKASQLLNIEFLDHIIMTDTDYVSIMSINKEVK
jgi:DNA repair protein RadC